VNDTRSIQENTSEKSISINIITKESIDITRSKDYNKGRIGLFFIYFSTNCEKSQSIICLFFLLLGADDEVSISFEINFSR